MRLRTVRLAALGQIDAGMASLATFIIHLWVVREFSLAEMGAWALIFGLFVDVSQVPAQLHLTPVEINAVRTPERLDRLGILRSSMVRGAAIAGVASLLIALGSLPLIGDVEGIFLAGLVLSAMAATVVSPVQDHVRRTMHLAGKSGVAAAMSITQFVVVVGGLLLAPREHLAYIPLGALVIANLASTTLGTVTVRFWKYRTIVVPGVRAASGVGSWLMGSSIVSGVLGYFSTVLIKTLTSIETLGLIEAARVVSRPVTVVSQGMNSVLGPRSMEAAVQGDVRTAKKMRWAFFGLFTAGTAPLLLLLVVPQTQAVVARVIPASVEVPELAIATVIAFWIASLYLPFSSELLGGGRHKQWAVASGVMALVQLLLIAAFSGYGAFVFPISAGIAGLIRTPVFAALARRLYRGPGGGS